FSSRRRHTRFSRDWSSDVCSSDLLLAFIAFSSAISQEMNDEEGGKIKISEFHITTGVVFNQIMNSSLEDYRTLDPQSELLKHDRSEERRVGKECRCRRWRYH